jgi:hypothetical protein
MAYITFKMTPKGGKEFAIANIQQVSWGVHRDPAPDNRVGRNGHDIDEIVVVRNKSLNGLDNDVVRQASQVGDKASCTGWISVARAANQNGIIQKLAWEEGHVAGLSTSVADESIVETITLVVTRLKVDDFTFDQGTGA